MAIFTGLTPPNHQGKTGVGELSPENAVSAELSRLEPIITPEQLKNRMLFGIPLVSRMKDPVTGKHQIMGSDLLKDIIVGALVQAEIDCKIDISPVERRFKMPFDRNAYLSFGFMMMPYRPVNKLKRLTITPANNIDVFSIPLEWIETSNMHRGQLNILPMTAAIRGGQVSGGQIPASVYFLALIGNRSWIPAWFQVEAVSGYPDSMVPRIINELIGTIAAWEVLSQLLSTYVLYQSHSLSIDGLSQSVSTDPRLFQLRLEELEAKRDTLTRRVKSLYGTGIFSSHM
jgi:hypothetical protein